MFDIISFDNSENMFEHLSEQNKLAREYADSVDAVKLINENNYWMMMWEDLLIIGEKQSEILPREEYEDEEEYQWEVDAAKTSLESGYIFGKWYSEACPEGELGSNHISTCIPINKGLFMRILDFIQKNYLYD